MLQADCSVYLCQHVEASNNPLHHDMDMEQARAPGLRNVAAGLLSGDAPMYEQTQQPIFTVTVTLTLTVTVNLNLTQICQWSLSTGSQSARMECRPPPFTAVST